MFAAVIKSIALHILFAIIVFQDLNIDQIDIKTGFSIDKLINCFL